MSDTLPMSHPAINYGLPASSASTKNVMAAITRAQKDMAPAVADCVNAAFRGNKRYADINAVTQACLPSLVANGLALTEPLHFFPHAQSATGFVNVLEVRISHGASDEFISSYFPFMAAKNEAQPIGGWITYARRYCLGSLLSIVTDADDDGNSASPDTVASGGGGGGGQQNAQGLGRQAAALLDGIKRATTLDGLNAFVQQVESGKFDGAELAQLRAALDARKPMVTPVRRNPARGRDALDRALDR